MYTFSMKQMIMAVGAGKKMELWCGRQVWDGAQRVGIVLLLLLLGARHTGNHFKSKRRENSEDG